MTRILHIRTGSLAPVGAVIPTLDTAKDGQRGTNGLNQGVAIVSRRSVDVGLPVGSAASRIDAISEGSRHDTRWKPTSFTNPTRVSYRRSSVSRLPAARTFGVFVFVGTNSFHPSLRIHVGLPPSPVAVASTLAPCFPAAIAAFAGKENSFETLCCLDETARVGAAPGVKGDGALPIGSVIGTWGTAESASVAPDVWVASSTSDPAVGRLSERESTLDPRQNILRTITQVRVRGSMSTRWCTTAAARFRPVAGSLLIATAELMLPAQAPAPTPRIVPVAPPIAVAAPAPPAPPAPAPAPEPPPWFQPEVYTVSVTAFVDDPSYHASSISAMALPELQRHVEMPADQLFADLSRPNPESEVDLALWAHEPPQDQAEWMRAALDAQVFAASDGPGTGAWGLSVFGGEASLKGQPTEEEMPTPQENAADEGDKEP